MLGDQEPAYEKELAVAAGWMGVNLAPWDFFHGVWSVLFLARFGLFSTLI